VGRGRGLQGLERSLSSSEIEEAGGVELGVRPRWVQMIQTGKLCYGFYSDIHEHSCLHVGE
jgi:hypothetical protein